VSPIGALSFSLSESPACRANECSVLAPRVVYPPGVSKAAERVVCERPFLGLTLSAKCTTDLTTENGLKIGRNSEHKYDFLLPSVRLSSLSIITHYNKIKDATSTSRNINQLTNGFSFRSKLT